jgi:hypothetical protein
MFYDSIDPATTSQEWYTPHYIFDAYAVGSISIRQAQAVMSCLGCPRTPITPARA